MLPFRRPFIVTGCPPAPPSKNAASALGVQPAAQSADDWSLPNPTTPVVCPLPFFCPSSFCRPFFRPSFAQGLSAANTPRTRFCTGGLAVTIESEQKETKAAALRERPLQPSGSLPLFSGASFPGILSPISAPIPSFPSFAFVNQCRDLAQDRPRGRLLVVRGESCFLVECSALARLVPSSSTKSLREWMRARSRWERRSHQRR